MPETRTAKLFRNGASQAVRLPAEFRFDGKEVYATRDEATGDVVLSQRPGAHSWSEFFRPDAHDRGTRGFHGRTADERSAARP
jgi:virulence-associated protein VagC